MKKYRVGLIGLGNMGRNHLRVLESLDETEKVLAYDISDGWRSTLLSSPKVEPAKNLEDLLSRSDAVVIAAQTSTHFELAKSCLEAGKHTLVEKPVTSTLEESNRLKEIYQAALAVKPDLVFGVGHIEHFNPAVQCALQSVRRGMIGTPVSASFRRIGGYPRKGLIGNNVVIDLAVHDIDLALKFVFSKSDNPKVLGSTTQSIRNPGVSDVTDILLGDSGGRTATIHVNWLTPFRSRAFWVVGTEGFLEVDLIEQSVTVRKSDLLHDFISSDTPSNFENLFTLSRECDIIRLGVHRQEPLKLELQTFLAALGGGPRFPIGLSEGTLALALALKVFE